MLDSKKFGSFIAAMRVKRGMKQVELAHKLKVSDKTVSKWECGKGFPDIQLLQPLARALDISLIELFECEYPLHSIPLEKANEVLADAIEQSGKQVRDVYRVVRGILLGIAGISLFVVLVCGIQIFMPAVITQALEVGVGEALVRVYGTEAMLYGLAYAGGVFFVSFLVYLWVADFTKPKEI